MLVRPSYAALLHVTTHLRDIDRRELAAMRWDMNEQAMAAEALEQGSPSWIACAENPTEPVYAFGLSPARPGVWSVWGFGTHRWPDVALQVTRWARRIIVPSLPKMGHRFECYSLAEKTAAHKWLKHFGAVEEGVLHSYGAGGEDFKLFAWTKKED